MTTLLKLGKFENCIKVNRPVIATKFKFTTKGSRWRWKSIWLERVRSFYTSREEKEGREEIDKEASPPIGRCRRRRRAPVWSNDLFDASRYPAASAFVLLWLA